ncbi:MAG: hypothetical protein LBQ73_02280 [Tannerellaceae bacterium]|jgi:hypothetical protein|nr:hypothetical protein [Tannerellaceae bacterium]
MGNKKKGGLSGKYTVTLTDRESGRVLQRVEKHNTITNAYKKYALNALLTATNLVAATRAAAGGSMPSAAAPTSFGLYLMNEQVGVHPDTYLAPYVDEARNGINGKVSFYDVGGAATEASNVMIPVDSACAFSEIISANKYKMRYVKNTGAGQVAALALGRAHSQPTGIYITAVKDINMPTEFFTGTTDYLLEHTAAGTVVWKNISTTSQFAANLRTKQFTAYNNANINTNISAQTGGLVVGGKIFKVAKKTASGTSYVATLTYVDNWQAATAAATIDITFTADGAVNTTVTPVLVARPAQNKIEIFVSGALKNGGIEIMKATVDVETLEVTVDANKPVIPYAISGYGTTVAQYMSGFYFEGLYHFPVYYNVNAAGALTGQTVAAYQEGIIIDAGFETVHDVVLYRSANNLFYAFVYAEEVLQLQVNIAAMTYIQASQIISATNLGAVINKTADQVLTIEYEIEII